MVIINVLMVLFVQLLHTQITLIKTVHHALLHVLIVFPISIVDHA